jgi:hypothetical protein
MARLTFTISDYDAEISTVQFPASDLTVGNITDEYADALLLQAELAKVSRGLILKREHVGKTSPLAVGKASSVEAQREEKALVMYYDDTTFVRASLEIPAVDMTKQHPSHPGIFYQAGVSGHHADWGTFKTQFENFVPGPSGNAAIIEKVIHVGRNL